MPKTASTHMDWIAHLQISFVLAIGVLFYTFAGAQVFSNALRNDFLSFYAAGLQLQAGDGGRIHDPKIQYIYQQKVQPGNLDVMPFPRPRVYAEVFRPLTALPQREAMLLWQGIQILGMGGLWYLLARRYGFQWLQLIAFFFPLPIGIAHGQDTGWMAFLAGLSLFLWQGGRFFWAGMALAACLFKWHLILPLGLAMLLGRHWGMLRGLFVGGLLFCGVDLLLDGPAGWGSYWAFLTRNDLERMTPGLEYMPSAKGLMANLGIEGLWWIPALLALLCLLRIAWTQSWPLAMLAAQVTAVFVMPHSLQYDLSYCLFPLMALLQSNVKGLLRWLAFVLLFPFPFLLTLFGRPWGGGLALLLLLLLAALAVRSKEAPTGTAG
jgi:hypothetical protein